MSSGDDGLYRGDPPTAAPPPPPGYAPPGFAPPPGYGPYAGYGYPPAFFRPPTNTMAILALVFAFVFAPVGLGLGVAARRQIRQTGEEGDGLALAGIIVGGIFTALFVLMIVFWIVAFVSITSSFGP
jgi:Domain of unknown function (DUF4190)